MKTSNCRWISALWPLVAALLLWRIAPASGGPAPHPAARPRLRIPAPADRALHVRSIPAVSGYSSNVYEVLMQPYHFDVPGLTAVAELAPMSSGEGEGAGVLGTLYFSQPHPPVGPVFVWGNVTGLSPGAHALHVHRWGDLRDGCDAAGPHFNPYMLPHGGPGEPVRHLGDLGNVAAGADGAANLRLVDGGLALAGPHSVLGRAVTVREAADDMGRGGTAHSPTTGGGGRALACGVVGLTRFMPPPPPMPPMMKPESGEKAAAPEEQVEDGP